MNGKKTDAAKPLPIRQDDVLTIVHRSCDFRISDETIGRFPFVNGKKEVCFRVGFSGGNAELRQTARRFNEYFSYCRKKGLVKGDGLCILVTDPDNGGPDMIRLKLAKGPGFISADRNGGILITAPDIAGLNRLVTALFYRMDRRFEFYEPFRNVMGLRASDFKAEGKRLPLRGYFD